MIGLALFWGIAGSLVSCNNYPMEGMIVAVEVSGGGDGSERGSTLIALDPGNPDTPATILNEDFFAVSAPVLSNNGRYLVFSGKKLQEEPWQIWQMDLQKRSITQVINLSENCTDPTLLPDGKVVFSRSGSAMNTRISSLFKCNRDGSELEQITFRPHSDGASSVLREGRILYTSSQQYPTQKDPVFMVMRPDGTKNELFYKAGQGASLLSGGSESDEGKIFFIENSDQTRNGNRLMMLDLNRPLHTAVELSKGGEGEFRSVIPYGKERCLVSHRSSPRVPFALYEFDINAQKILNKVYDAEGDVVSPLLMNAKKRSRILPSAVDHENPTGLLMSQNINHSMIPSKGLASNDTLADRIQIHGLDGLISEVEVKEDGSFYLKIDSDIPIHLVTMNHKREVIRGPSEWIWMRPNERRGCVGCHADPELAPDNIQPLAVQHPPVIVSVTQKEISKLEESEK